MISQNTSCLFKLLLLLLLLTYGCTNKQNSYEININDSLIGELDSKEKRSLLKDFSQAIDSVTTYFNVSFEETLYVYVIEAGHGEASSNNIYIPKRSIFNKELIIHEVTHSVLKTKGSSFQREALAVFMELKFGILNSKQTNSYYNALHIFRSQIFPIKSLLQDDIPFIIARFPDNSLAYAQAGYFYLFLEEQFGIEKIRELQRKGISEIEMIYETSVDSLETEWIKWFFPISSYTMVIE